MTTTIRRAALTLAGLTLTAGSLTACGGGDDADSTAGSSSSPSASPSAEESPSEDASESPAGGDATGTEFCNVYADLFQQVSARLGAGEDISTIIPEMKQYAEQLEEAGPPDDIPEEAEKGFEISLDAIKDLPDDATQEDLMAAGSDYSAEDQAAAQSFGEYVVTACPELMSSAPTPSS